ncbi:MAG: indole-3-glycerol phosphate synthase TrpC [Tannerella sp.]|nr:indole-3-glycerol phosphate synthase TrpC [Tannerella sp.]
MDILDKIVTAKRLEVARMKEAVPLDVLLGFGQQRFGSATRSMRRALEASPTGIIAEFKRRSPSKGWLCPGAKAGDVVPAYEQAGASACSILTDTPFFGGNYHDLPRVRHQVSLPLLRKDFIIDAYQLYQARVMGADAVLLIAAILTKNECEAFADLARRLGMEVLLEVHSPGELSHLNENVDMLGVNNRHLGTFHTDVENSFRMIRPITSEAGGNAPLLVSESGISDAGTVKKLRDAGFRGFLIGETFMKTGDPAAALAKFIHQLIT